MDELAFIVFLGLVLTGAVFAVKSEVDGNKAFHNQCVEAGGTPMRLAKQGNICLKDATQIPLILKVS